MAPWPGMRRLSLPLHSASGTQQPTADDVRRRLGGAGQSEAGAGVVVRFVDDPGAGTLGVVLFRHGEEVDVYLGDGWLRRTRAASVEPLAVEAPDSLATVASDVRVFHTLRNGDRVRYADATGNLLDGTLLEKCRYGAIVLSDSQRLIGIGFRKLWPAPSSEPA